MQKVFADIITIGDELLMGQVVDTNATYIADELTRAGISVRRTISVSDQSGDITNALDDSIQHSEISILTGGLGPTSDDITKETLARYFGGVLVVNEPTLRDIEQFFLSRNAKITDRNRKQAEIPNVCQVLRNKNGTAPGMLFKKNDRIIISLPGVPFEMKALMQDEVIPVLRSHFILPQILYTSVLTTGLSESYTADLLKEWENALPQDYRFAYLPSIGILKLRLSVSGDNEEQLKLQLRSRIEQLVKILGKKHVFGYDNETLQQVVGNKLKKRQKSLSIAESCTGGYISHLITSVHGSSAYFKGSVTSYANEIKMKLLKVTDFELAEYGAVSRNVVEQMASGARQLFATDYSVATSGIAGPDGGTDDKPVGTTWIAVASPDGIVSGQFLFGDNRERNIIRASVTALNMLRISMDTNSKK
jgi:nicotinamide-nucleotide amidase